MPTRDRTRRAVVSVLGWSAFSAAAAPAVGALLNGGRQRGRVLVLGAGLAGLAAAFELEAAGHEVTLLDAQSRPGGRVLTLRESFADGLHAEAGGMAVGARYRHYHRYREHFGLTMAPFANTPGLGTIRHLQGKRRVFRDGSGNWPYVLSATESTLGLGGLANRYLLDLIERIGDPSAPDWDIRPLMDYDALSLADCLRSRGASEGAIQLLRDNAWYGQGIDVGSALGMLIADFAIWRTGEPSGVLDGGNDQLPKAMAASLKGSIHYGMPVRVIRHTDSGVQVLCGQPGDGEPRRFEADRCICTLPLPTLRGITFEPSVPSAMREAINRVTYLPFLRLFAQMRRQYWLDSGVAGPASSDLPIGQVQRHPLARSGGPQDRAILEGHLRGPQVAPVAGLASQARQDLLVAELEKIHPGARQHYEGGAEKSWLDDPWSGGGLSWYEPGQIARWMSVTAQAIGRIHFAGEHTSPLRATMEGALSSGMRAALEAHRALS